MFVLMKSQMSLKMGYVGSKTMSLGQMLEKPCVRSRGHIFCPIIMKLVDNNFLDKISDNKRSLSQILEKPCVLCRGHIFCPIIMKLGQNIYLDEISDEFENWSCQVKNYVTRSNVIITLCKL